MVEQASTRMLLCATRNHAGVAELVDATDLEQFERVKRNLYVDGIKFGETLTGHADDNAELRLAR